MTIDNIRKRVDAFNYYAARGPHYKTQEMLDLEVVLKEYDNLREACELIILGTAEPATVARNALAGKELDTPTYCPHGFYLGNCPHDDCEHAKAPKIKASSSQDSIALSIPEEFDEQAVSLSNQVAAIFLDCLFKEGEITERTPPGDAVIIEGLVRTFTFHPKRLAEHAGEIAKLCDEMSPLFHKSGGGGWTFLNLCMDRKGNQWGEQPICETLLVLAIGTGQGGFLMPRDMWNLLPGGMPYVWLGH